jgi:hypothetical protein
LKICFFTIIKASVNASFPPGTHCKAEPASISHLSFSCNNILLHLPAHLHIAVVDLVITSIFSIELPVMIPTDLVVVEDSIRQVYRQLKFLALFHVLKFFPLGSFEMSGTVLSNSLALLPAATADSLALKVMFPSLIGSMAFPHRTITDCRSIKFVESRISARLKSDLSARTFMLSIFKSA